MKFKVVCSVFSRQPTEIFGKGTMESFLFGMVCAFGFAKEGKSSIETEISFSRKHVREIYIRLARNNHIVKRMNEQI